MAQNTIIVTSNNQLTCTVNHISDAAGLDILENCVFDNGTVISIEGFGETSKIEMIHPLEVSNPSRFTSLEKFNDKFKDPLPIPLSMGTQKYVVRHGVAGHNDPKTSMTDAHDASITSIGREQAGNSGRAILKRSRGVLPNLKAKSSDLKRTWETMDEILQQFPEDQRTDTCEVCIEARENSRAIGGKHHWQINNPLREFAIDPFISSDKLKELAPGKSPEENERMRIENLPKNDPFGKPDDCVRKINDLKIDWSVYLEKLTKGYASGKTFGQIASDKTLFEIIFEKP
jgi:hypothetical protein